MSWFADVAGKAEELLNRVDKSAAVALQINEEKSSRQPNYEISAYALSSNDNQSLSQSKQVPSYVPASSMDRKISPSTGAIPKSSKPAFQSVKSKSPPKTTSDEESLLDFLNAPEKTPPKLNEVPVKVTKADSVPTKQDDNVSDNTPNEMEIIVEKIEEPVIETPITEIIITPNHAPKIEAETNKQSVVKPPSHLASEVRELKAREVDYVAALEAKDSQLAVLRVRFQEADFELKSTKEALKKYSEDNERLMKEHTAVSEVNSDAITKLKQKLEETELAFQQEKNLREKATTEARSNFSKLEEEKQQHAANLSSTQKNLTELKAQVKDLNQQLRQSKSSLETVKQDLAYYRQKAQRLLQSKEKLISTLKDNNVSNDEQMDGGEGNRITLEESLTKENDSLREELIQSKATCEILRSELQSLEQSYQEEVERGNERVRHLDDNLQIEKQCREDLENEIEQLKEELKFLREDLTRNKTNLHARIKDRDLEVEKLRKQLTAKITSGSNQSELESRIRNLTESLIQKQTVLEALSTEKNSLVMQLERMEQRMKDLQSTSNKTNISVGIPVEDLKNRNHGSYFVENAFDGRVTKNVKRAYGIIDSLSIRTGSFLRRNPASRAFLLAYMFLLHIWVLIILISYQPEIHGGNFKINLPQL